MIEPLRHPGFRRLLIGQTVSALGDWMATIAMIVLVLDLTGSSTAVGGILVLQLLPAAIAGPIATGFARRWNRRRTMLAADAARAGIALLIPLVRAMWWVYVWAFVLQIASLVFLPARDASIPDLAGEEDLPLANGLILGSSYGTIPLGAAAFGGVVALHGLVFGRTGALGTRPFLLVFVLDALTFLVSFAFVRPLRELDAAPGVSTGPAPGRDAVWPASHAAASAGFLGAFRIPLVRAVLPATATVSLGVGTLFSVGVVFVRSVLDASDAEFGGLIALFGIGAAAGLALLRLVRPREELSIARVAVAVQGATIAVIGLAPGLGIAFLEAAVFGLATSVTLLVGMSLLQARLDAPQRVQAFAAFHVVIRGGSASRRSARGSRPT